MQIAEKRKKHIEQVSGPQQNIFIRAYETNSKKAAIQAKCLDCSGFSPAEAAQCPCETCPLYEHNPYRKRLNQRIEDRTAGLE